MKKTLLNIITFSLAVYIAYICGGVNIHQYCCDLCEYYGKNIFNTTTCCEIHHHSYKSYENCSNSFNQNKSIIDGTHDFSINSKTKHCSFHHLEAPLLQKTNVESFSFTYPLVAVLLEFQIDHSIFSVEQSICCYSEPIYLLPQQGRSIIIHKSSFLI